MSTNRRTKRLVVTTLGALVVAGSGLLGAMTAQAAGPACRSLTVNAGAGIDKLVYVATGDVNGDAFKDCTGPYGVKSNAISVTGGRTENVWGHLPAPHDAEEAFLSGL